MDDRYVLRLSRPEDTERIYALTRSVLDSLADKELFAVEDLDLDWYRRNLEREGFGITAWAPDGTLAGALIVCYPGSSDENLAPDAGLSPAERPLVAQLESAAVLPAHRGHHLEERMIRFAEEQIPASRWPILLATVSPKNPASLISVQRNGYRIVCTKEKYGGLMRHIMMKDRRTGAGNA